MRDPLSHLRSYGESIRSAVPPARSHVVAMRAVAAVRRSRPRRLIRTLAISLGLFLIANVAAASIAGSALPGDLLYPVHRGYERLADVVGLGSGNRLPDRVEEAQALMERDRPDDALEHLANSLDDPGLQEAAERIRSLDLPRNELKEEVADLVAAANAISEAARSEDPEALRAAVAEIRRLAERIAAAGKEDPPGSPSGPSPGRPDEPGSGGGQSKGPRGDRGGGDNPGRGGENRGGRP